MSQMDESNPDVDDTYTLVFKATRRGECFERRLVLDSVGIDADAFQRGGWWCLQVATADVAAAKEEIDAYERENKRLSTEVPTVSRRRGGAVLGVVGYAAVLMAVEFCIRPWGRGLDLFPVGQMQAGLVVDGQWWRAVTALTLHVDAGHLLANLVFGIVFGLLAGRAVGGGVAWLAIVAAGACGNAMNALMRPADHSAVGASTAVFAALALVVGFTLAQIRSHRAIRGWEGRRASWRRWSPLIAGVLLLAYTGLGGERTDVGAHFMGFVAGLAFGLLAGKIPPRWLDRDETQGWSGVAAISLVAVAWAIALLRGP